MDEPGPIVGENGLEEYMVEEILDARRRGRGWQFLVRWAGYGVEHNHWLSAKAINECKALDKWYEEGSDGPGRREELRS